MNSLCYDCAIQAAYMIKEFGIKFYNGTLINYKGINDYPDEKMLIGDLQREITRFGKIYVAPESEHIFEPKEGDYDDRGGIFINLGGKGLWRSLLAMNGYEKSEIVMRDKKHFFQPETE